MGALGITIGIVILFIIAVVIAMIVLFWGAIVKFFANIFKPPPIFPPGQPLGGKCTVATDCKGWGPKDGTVCCDGVCTKPGCQKAGVCTKPGCQKAGAWYCPKDCEQPIGGDCKVATDCEGWGPKDGTVCCDSKCTKPGCQKLGAWYCPKDCPQPAGGRCRLHTDCKGWGPKATDMACCKGRCERKQKDWAGVGYCPYACVGKPLGKKGTC